MVLFIRNIALKNLLAPWNSLLSTIYPQYSEFRIIFTSSPSPSSFSYVEKRKPVRLQTLKGELHKAIIKIVQGLRVFLKTKGHPIYTKNEACISRPISCRGFLFKLVTWKRKWRPLFCRIDRRQRAHAITDWTEKSKVTSPGEGRYYYKARHDY